MIIIADLISNKKFNYVVPELFIRGTNLNISTVFITQTYFSVLKDVRLNCKHFFIMKILNKQDLQQIATNNLSNTNSKDFESLQKVYCQTTFSFSD